MGSTRTPRGGSPAASIAWRDLARGPAHVLALDVRGQGQVALRHVAVDTRRAARSGGPSPRRGPSG